MGYRHVTFQEIRGDIEKEVVVHAQLGNEFCQSCGVPLDEDTIGEDGFIDCPKCSRVLQADFQPCDCPDPRDEP